MIKSNAKNQKGQNAIEYLLLLGVATAIALVGFKTLLPKVNESSELYFNRSVNAILDTPPGLANMERFKTYP